MAVSSVTNRRSYQGDGTSAVFAFQYELHSPSDLAVFAFNSSSTTPGIILPLTLNASGGYGYVFSGTQDNAGIYPSGGTVILNSSPNADTVLVLFRSSAITADFLVNRFQAIPGDAITNAIDRLTLIAQRAQDIGTRSVRLADGFPAQFDTSLPANILQSAGKRLIVNSSATGWTFDETTASYITNTLVYAHTNSSVTSLGGAVDGRALLSRGSSQPEWAQLNLGSSATFTGTLPATFGGTGNNSSHQTWGMLSFDGASYVPVPPAAAGSILTANASSAPTFQAFAASNINSGMISVANGGTGTAEVFPPQSVVFVGSGGVYVQSPKLLFNSSAAGGLTLSSLVAAPLRTNGTGVLVSGSTSLSNEVSNTLPILNGGTGHTAFTQHGVVYASSTTQLATVPSSTSGFALIANGSSAPSFQPVAVTNQVTTINSATNLTTSNNLVLGAGSSNYNVNLYTAVGNTGRLVKVVKVAPATGTSLLNSISITCQAGEYINQASSVYLAALNEFFEFQSDGVGWRVVNHRVPGGGTVYLRNEQGTSGGGTMTVGSNNYMVLNVNEGDTTFARLTGSSSFFVLQPGRYMIDGTVQCVEAGAFTCKLFNQNEGANIVIGEIGWSSGGGATAQGVTSLKGLIVINTSKTMAIRYGAGATKATVGFGQAANFQDIGQYYGTFAITKIG